MSKHFAVRALFVSLVLVVLAAFTLWYVSPQWLFGDPIRPVEVQTRSSTLDLDYQDARVYSSLDELQADYDWVEISPGIVDFTHDKLVRIDWQGSGYYTDQMWQSADRGEPLYGEIRYDLSCGGKQVDFHFVRPTPGGGMFGVDVHSVFSMLVGTDWYVVPESIEVHYRRADASDIVFALAFLALCILILATCSSGRLGKRNDTPILQGKRSDREADPPRDIDAEGSQIAADFAREAPEPVEATECPV